MARIQPVPWEDLPDEVREHIEEGRRRGTVSGDSMPVFAHSPYVALDILDRSEGRYRQGRLGGRLGELIRLRSAQIAACGPCSLARKDPSVSEEDVACLIDPEHTGLSSREVLAMKAVDLMATDHDAIDEAFLLMLAECFDTEELVELLYRAGQSVGSHRFVHVLDVLGNTKPVLGYEPEVVKRSWERAYLASSEHATPMK